MRIEFDIRALKAAAFAVQRDETRYYLNGVCVEWNGHDLVCVATNGKTLIAIRPDFTIVSNEQVAPFQVIIPADYIAALKVDKRVHFAALMLEDGKWFLDYFGLRQFIPVDGTFPAWRRVLPTKLSGVTAHYDPELIMGFQKAAKVYGAKQIVSIGHNGDEPAMIGFNCAEINGFGVAMPCRSEVPSLPPFWASVSMAVPTEAVAA